ncbi:unnamed protein product [Clonostachys solani]|uniref:Uncharacterized protein n=1 Tax=Clonostachys solani TaxID=160281 RepID=A0A9N9ZMN8_9HYPO|nr:unnamed protein product [Clonostachys solani]
MFWVLCLTIAATATARSCGRMTTMKNLVTFGDSVTDDGRIAYFQEHMQFHSPGTIVPIAQEAATGGATWGRLVANITGANYNNYAFSGATCSKDIVERYVPGLGIAFPTILEQEIPAFEADLGFDTLYPNREADNTVYAIMIGANDLGISGYLSDSQAPGSTVQRFVDCVWDVLDKLYASGGRFFVVMNVMPLEITPLYKSVGKGGLEFSTLFPTKPDINSTLYEQRIFQSTSSANDLFSIGGPFHLKPKNRWPGATLAIFDTNRLLKDIHANPERFLGPRANVDGVYQFCQSSDVASCTRASEPKSNFMWFDELHPSERTSEIIAQSFIDTIQGNSSYATYWL